MTYDAEAEAGALDEDLSTLAREEAESDAYHDTIADALRAAHAAGKREGAESMRERAAQCLVTSPHIWRDLIARDMRALPLDDGGDQ